jgi:serine protease AprX
MVDSAPERRGRRLSRRIVLLAGSLLGVALLVVLVCSDRTPSHDPASSPSPGLASAGDSARRARAPEKERSSVALREERPAPQPALEAGDESAGGSSSAASEERAAREPRSKVSPELLDRIDREPYGAGRVPVILQTYALWSRKNLEATVLERRGANVVRELNCIGAWAVEVPVSEILALASDPGVRRISSDALVTSFSHVTIPTTGTDLVWPQTLKENGVDGAGITVAVIDSGGRDELVDLRRGKTKRVLKRLDMITNLPDGLGGNAADGYGHGTHVAGIIGGDGDKSLPYTVRFQGVAPNCDLVTLKVLGDDGCGFVSSVIAAIHWCILNKDEYRIRVINLSLGHPAYESYKTDPLALACAQAVDAGIVVVCSAGNNGWYDGHPVYGGINSPGHSPWVITVGSTDSQRTEMRSDDGISPFSSRGPTPIDGLIKPDIVAPGRNVIALLAPNCRIARDYPQLVVYGRDFGATGPAAEEAHYLRMSGTSMSTPVVSGTVALMLQKNSSLTPNAVKAILMYTAEKMTVANALEQGAGYLNVEGAVRLAGEIHSRSDQLSDGTAWLKNGPEYVKPLSIIAGEAVYWGSALLWGRTHLYGSAVDWRTDKLWGDGILWTNAILWAQGFNWDDPLMSIKQAAYGAGTTITKVDGSRAILWSNAIIWSNGNIVQGDRAIIWSNDVSSKWNGNFVDPTSLGSATAIHVPADGSEPTTEYVIGPIGSWYYPILTLED